MTSLTSQLRAQRPSYYVKKDSRTAILRIVFGRVMTDGQRNTPGKVDLDTWETDHNTIRNTMALTQWPADRRTEIYDAHEKQKPKAVVFIEMQEAA
jgi:hypothetical protein